MKNIPILFLITLLVISISTNIQSQRELVIDYKNIEYDTIKDVEITDNEIIIKALEIGKSISPTYESNDCVHFMTAFLDSIGVEITSSLRDDISINSISFDSVKSILEKNPDKYDVDDKIKGVQYALYKRGLGMPVDDIQKGDLVQYWNTVEIEEFVKDKRGEYYLKHLNGFEFYNKIVDHKIDKSERYRKLIKTKVVSGHCGIVTDINSKQIKLLSSHPISKGFGEMVIDIPYYIYAVRLNKL